MLPDGPSARSPDRHGHRPQSEDGAKTPRHGVHEGDHPYDRHDGPSGEEGSPPRCRRPHDRASDAHRRTGQPDQPGQGESQDQRQAERQAQDRRCQDECGDGREQEQHHAPPSGGEGSRGHGRGYAFGTARGDQKDDHSEQQHGDRDRGPAQDHTEDRQGLLQREPHLLAHLPPHLHAGVDPHPLGAQDVATDLCRPGDPDGPVQGDDVAGDVGARDRDRSVQDHHVAVHRPRHDRPTMEDHDLPHRETLRHGERA